jgi:hypothetical protein
MATVIEIPQPQFTSEIRVYPFDFTDDLLDGVTVSSAVVTHTPPSGSGSVAGTAVSSPIVNATFGTVAVTGTHYLDCLATLSDSEKSAMRLIIHVPR